MRVGVVGGVGYSKYLAKYLRRNSDSGHWVGLGLPSHYPRACMPTRYLIFGALVTALVILVGVGLWFLLGVL